VPVLHSVICRTNPVITEGFAEPFIPSQSSCFYIHDFRITCCIYFWRWVWVCHYFQFLFQAVMLCMSLISCKGGPAHPDHRRGFPSMLSVRPFPFQRLLPSLSQKTPGDFSSIQCVFLLRCLRRIKHLTHSFTGLLLNQGFFEERHGTDWFCCWQATQLFYLFLFLFFCFLHFFFGNFSRFFPEEAEVISTVRITGLEVRLRQKIERDISVGIFQLNFSVCCYTDLATDEYFAFSKDDCSRFNIFWRPYIMYLLFPLWVLEQWF